MMHRLKHNQNHPFLPPPHDTVPARKICVAFTLISVAIPTFFLHLYLYLPFVPLTTTTANLSISHYHLSNLPITNPVGARNVINDLAYEAVSTKSDVVMFVKGVNNRQGTIDSDDNLSTMIKELNGSGYDVKVVTWVWQKTHEAGFSHGAVIYLDTCPILEHGMDEVLDLGLAVEVCRTVTEAWTSPSLIDDKTFVTPMCVNV